MSGLRFLLVVACLALLTTACGGKLGDPCTQSSECPDKCQTGGGFPGGICTLECDKDAACAEGWRCITKSSGICMQSCTSSDTCKATYGDEWVCDDESLQDGAGSAQVCIGQ